ncbi:nuclear transport factor 2 family protein [Novosphingobium sp.]|uniref:nuclear transport factor 2 family protein n=1 Tax=Novosphingobium sp. TaxID=1874826 RepID=UPI0038BC9887
MSVADILALRHTAEIYARGADRRCKADWEAVLADDVEISGPGFHTIGRAANLESIDLLARMFRATRHLIHNQTVTIDGDIAYGETVATAEHVVPQAEGEALLCWAIRYQDVWRHEADAWRFTRRELVVDWQELRPLAPTGAL